MLMRFFFICLFLKLALNSFSQAERKHFELIGTADVNSGTVRLQPIGDSSFYELGLSTTLDSISYGKFKILGSLNSPIAFRLRIFKGEELIYISDIFFVQAGRNFIKITIDSIGETPRIKNEAMILYEELKSELNQAENKGEQWAEEFSKIHLNENTDPNNENRLISNKLSIIDSMKADVINRFSSRNRNSFIPLWILIDDFSNGYNSSLLESFKNLSERVRTSFPGSILGLRMFKASALSIGKKFPLIRATNLSSNIEEEICRGKNAKYTLIEFWFENCSPCLQQFKYIQKYYQNYYSLNFEVIAVSIDPISKRSNLISLIEKHNFPWRQYFNASAFANEYFITKYPTSYLIDSKGMIVMVDVTPVRLQDFLNYKL